MKKINFCKIFILSIVFVNFLNAANSDALQKDIKKYDGIFNKVSKTRIGTSEKSIIKTKSPFLVHLKAANGKSKKIKKIYFKLDIIFNKKAKINGKWIKLYSKIGTYKLVNIKKSSIVLKNKKYTREIFIRKNNASKIKFSSK